MEKRYLKIEKPSPRYDCFLFFDTDSHLADPLFSRRKIRIRFDREWKKDGSPYVAILCRVRKKDVPAFLEALADLEKSMLLCGYRDYEAEISGFLETMAEKG